MSTICPQTTKTSEAVMHNSAEDILSTKEFNKQRISTTNPQGKHLEITSAVFHVECEHNLENMKLNFHLSSYTGILFALNENIMLPGARSYTRQSLPVFWEAQTSHKTYETLFHTRLTLYPSQKARSFRIHYNS